MRRGKPLGILSQVKSKLMFALISHLMGIFYRTIRMMENGIKPLYVFDGKPPEMKSGEVQFYSQYPQIICQLCL